MTHKSEGELLCDVRVIGGKLEYEFSCKNVKNMVAASPAQAAAQVQALKTELARLKQANGAKGGAAAAQPANHRPMTTAHSRGPPPKQRGR